LATNKINPSLKIIVETSRFDGKLTKKTVAVPPNLQNTLIESLAVIRPKLQDRIENESESRSTIISSDCS
jgi:hypothetical protein